MPFGIDSDLPLEMINTRPYPEARFEILVAPLQGAALQREALYA